MFAWSTNDMPEIDTKGTCHQLPEIDTKGTCHQLTMSSSSSIVA